MLEQLKKDFADLQVEYNQLQANVREGQAALAEMGGALKYLKARIEASEGEDKPVTPSLDAVEAPGGDFPVEVDVGEG